MFGRNVINLGVAIQLHDQFSNKAKAVTDSMLQMNSTALKVARNADKMASTGFNMLAAGGAVLYGMNNAINTAAEYRHTLAQIGATVETLTDAQFKTLDDRIKQVGISSVYTIQEIANATRELARQGMPFDLMVKSIGSINDVAQATGTNLQTTADFFSSMLSIYPETKGNTDKLASQMVFAANKSRASIDALQNSFNYMGASAKQMNMPVSHSLALLMRLADAGLKGSQGGTVADNFIRFYAKSMGPLAGKRQKQGLAMMGLSQKDFVDAQGNLLAVDKALELIGTRLRGMKSKDAQSAVSAAFGERGKRAFITVEQAINASKEMKGYIQGLENVATDYAAKQSAKVVDNIWGDIARLKDALLIMKIEVIEPLEPALRIVFKILTKTVNIITALGSSKVGSAMLGITLVISSALVIYGGLNLLLGKGIKFLMHYAFGWKQWRSTSVAAINSAAAAMVRLNLLQQQSAALAQIQARGLRAVGTYPSGKTIWRDSRGFAKGPQANVSMPSILMGGGTGGFGRAAVYGRYMGMRTGLGGVMGALGTAGGMIARYALPALAVVSVLGFAADALGLFKSKTDEAREALEKETRNRNIVMERINLNKSWSVTEKQAQQLTARPIQVVFNVDGEEKIKKVIQQNDKDTFHYINFE
jgi:TP901 family phage tail tape measure protein